MTPHDGGAQGLLGATLQTLGFRLDHLRFGDVCNLVARIGTGRPYFCFAGHTDVVPPGDGWRHDPFGGVIEDGLLYGRGACDMKGAIACFVAACERHLESGPLAGSIGLLITGDEEGPARDGTARVLDWMAAEGCLPDAWLVGEPTNAAQLGDVVKIGRRGSLNATITVAGVQGHVAYPHRAANPVHPLLAVLSELVGHKLDEGTARFAPSSLQVTSIDVGNPASNVIPGSAQARLNIRFNDRHSGASLAAWLEGVVARHAPGAQVAISISGEAFLTGSALGERFAGVIAGVCGRRPALDTGGGTSDARFISRFGPVAEFGLVGASMHKADEHVALADLAMLTDIYAEILRDFLR